MCVCCVVFSSCAFGSWNNTNGSSDILYNGNWYHLQRCCEQNSHSTDDLVRFKRCSFRAIIESSYWMRRKAALSIRTRRKKKRRNHLAWDHNCGWKRKREKNHGIHDICSTEHPYCVHVVRTLSSFAWIKRTKLTNEFIKTANSLSLLSYEMAIAALSNKHFFSSKYSWYSWFWEMFFYRKTSLKVFFFLLKCLLIIRRKIQTKT